MSIISKGIIWNTKNFVHARNYYILGSFLKILYACGIPFCESTYFVSFFDGEFLKCDILPVSNDPVFLVVLSGMQLCSSFRPNSRHTSPGVLLSLQEGVSSRLGYAFPFLSHGQVSCAITLHLSRLRRLLHSCTIWKVSHTMCLVSMLGPLWGFHCRSSTFHYERYHYSLLHPIFRLISDSTWYLERVEHPLESANN